MGLSALMFASILAGCCMFWKRAYDDSMPDHVDRYMLPLCASCSLKCPGRERKTNPCKVLLAGIHLSCPVWAPSQRLPRYYTAWFDKKPHSVHSYRNPRFTNVFGTATPLLTATYNYSAEEILGTFLPSETSQSCSMGSVQRQRSSQQTDPGEASEARRRSCGEAGSPGGAHRGENARVKRGQDNANMMLLGSKIGKSDPPLMSVETLETLFSFLSLFGLPFLCPFMPKPFARKGVEHLEKLSRGLSREPWWGVMAHIQ